MPSILNIANISGENKASNKPKFSIGEKFSGKLVKDSETGELKVRLREGIEISAEIEGKSDLIEKDKFIKFEIKGFENGKLKLKVVNSETKLLKNQNEEIEGFIKQQGLSKEDVDVIKYMIKHDMKLSKEEILKVRTLLNFKTDAKENRVEINKFINSFLKSKGISKESQEGKNVVKALNKFFEKLGNLKSEELLSMLENNIELNNESIESFLKLTKESGQTLKNLEKVIKIQEDPKNIVKIEENLEVKNQKNNDFLEKNTNIKNIKDDNIMAQNKSNEDLKSQSIINQKIIENPKIKENNMKNLFKDILLSRNSEGVLNNPIKALTNLKGLTEEKIINCLENLRQESNLPISNLDKNEIENIFSNLIGESVSIKKDEVENIKAIFKNIIGENSEIEDGKLKQQFKIQAKEVIEPNNKGIEHNLLNKDEEIKENIGKDILENHSLKNFKATNALTKEVINLKNNAINVESQIKEKCSEIKSLVKEIINKGENLGFNIPKETISDLKVINSLNNNYYMLDLPLKLNEQEMECKLMIKDDRKSGKKIDSKNVRLVVTVDTINMGKIDGYLKVIDKNLNIDLKCNERWIKPITLGKDVLLKSLNSIGYMASISVSKRIEEANISNCREFFNDKTILVLDRRV